MRNGGSSGLLHAANPKTINNTGQIFENQVSSSGSTQIRIASQTVTLTGAGQLTLSDNGLNEIFGNSGNNQLVNVNNVISGAGQLGAAQLTLINRAGGVINVALKSGGNRFHGTIYEFARRSAWDANSFQNNSRCLTVDSAGKCHGAPKEGHYLDQYGPQIDGPVYIPKVYDGRNKTFLLFN